MAIAYGDKDREEEILLKLGRFAQEFMVNSSSMIEVSFYETHKFGDQDNTISITVRSEPK